VRPRILSTQAYSLSRVWLERVDVIERRTLTRLRLLARLVRSARNYDAIVLDGSGGWATRYVDLVAAATIARLRNGPAVLITDCSWKLGGNALDRAACRLGLKLIDAERVIYCVRSTDELELLPAVWGMDPARVVFTPYGHTLTEVELAVTPKRTGSIFAGGNALRDYRTLLTAVRGLENDVTIATSLAIDAQDLPPNVKVVPVHPHGLFIELMRNAEVVVVPFKAGIRRAAGLDTYLSAMGLGSVVIVTQCPGTRDYIEDGVTGIIVPPEDPDALRSALEWALDPANEGAIRSMRRHAKEVAAERFTFTRHAEILLDVVDGVVAGNVQRRRRPQPSRPFARRRS
jgi:Glycosyl transferases group 1